MCSWIITAESLKLIWLRLGNSPLLSVRKQWSGLYVVHVSDEHLDVRLGFRFILRFERPHTLRLAGDGHDQVGGTAN